MKRSYFLIVIFIFGLLGRSAWPGNPLLFVGDDAFPPYSYEENNKLQGIDVDIIKEMAERLNLDIAIRLVPWKRLIKMTQDGQCDGSFSLFHTKNRESFALYAFSQPIHVSRFPLFFRKDKIIQFNTIEDLYGKTIGINRGFSISEAFDSAVEQGKIIVNTENQVDENILLTASGIIDGFTNNYDVTKYKIKNIPRLRQYKDLIFHTKKSISESRNAYVVLSKKAPNIPDKTKMLHRINQTLIEMKKDGFYLELNNRYLE